MKKNNKNTLPPAYKLHYNLIRFKHDLQMWHMLGEYARWMHFIAETEEQHEYEKCKHYSYDDDAFEEYCNCVKIKRKKDFNAKDECYRCKYYAPK